LLARQSVRADKRLHVTVRRSDWIQEYPERSEEFMEIGGSVVESGRGIGEGASGTS
jgi:hypothetical protein